MSNFVLTNRSMPPGDYVIVETSVWRDIEMLILTHPRAEAVMGAREIEYTPMKVIHPKADA